MSRPYKITVYIDHDQPPDLDTIERIADKMRDLAMREVKACGIPGSAVYTKRDYHPANVRITP